MNWKKRLQKKIAPVMTILTGIFLILYVVLRAVLIWHMQADNISIIGGADAPTAEFLFRELGWKYILQVVVAIACIVIGINELIRGGRHD